jgi:hypothetical protein
MSLINQPGLHLGNCCETGKICFLFMLGNVTKQCYPSEPARDMGADALAGLALLLYFPSWLMIMSMLAGAIVWSLEVLIWRHGKNVHLRLWAVLQTHAKNNELPGFSVYALAILYYGLYRLVVVRI